MLSQLQPLYLITASLFDINFIIIIIIIIITIIIIIIIIPHNQYPYFRFFVQNTVRVTHVLLHRIFLIILGEQNKFKLLIISTCLHSPVSSSLLGPNILLYTLLSHILSPWSSFQVRYQVLHRYNRNKTAVTVVTSSASLWNMMKWNVERAPS
jgi:hypothetical protein